MRAIFNCVLLNKYFVKVLCAILALSIIIISCQKEDFVNGSMHLPHENLTAKFFNHLHPLRQQVLRVYNELERQNNLTGFIEKFAKAEGMAVWDKATVSLSTVNTIPDVYQNNFIENNQDTVVFIPLVLENDNKVNSYIKAVLNNAVLLMLGRSGDYEKYPFTTVAEDSMSAEKYALLLMIMTKHVFEIKDFKITDPRLFPNLIIPADKPQSFRMIKILSTTDENSKFEIICTYTYFLHCVNTEPCGAGYCDGCPACVTWIVNDCDIEDTDPFPGFPTGTGTGSSGGSGGTPIYDSTGGCNKATNIIIEGIPPCDTSSNGGGWESVPWSDENEPPPNPCDSFIHYLQNNVNFSTNFKSLLQPSVLNNNVEVGFKINLLNNQFEYITGVTPATTGVAGEIDLGSATPLSGTIHAHTQNTATMFSPTDVINQMAKLFLENKAQEPANLFAAIATNNGPYLIKITDTASFRKMANKIYSPTDSSVAKKFSTKYKETFRWLTDSTANELEFLQMLENFKKGGGIRLYKGNTDCNKWSALSYSTTLPPSGPTIYSVDKKNCF